MALEAEFLKQLVATFKTELDEKLQIITEGLVALEKSKEGDFKTLIESIFRAAHNIKGSARSVGIMQVGEIAHQIESLFSAIQNKNLVVSADIINLCLLAVDAMHSAMQSYCENKPLSFNLEKLIAHLQQAKPLKAEEISEISGSFQEEKAHQTTEFETIRVALKQVEQVSALVEQLQITKIALEDHFLKLSKITNMSKPLAGAEQGMEQLHKINKVLTLLYKNMYNNMNELNLITNSLQEEVRFLRLVPASVLLRHLTRSVRDLGQELGKKVEFKISGDQVRMDKIILEGLKDPIIHLLRNAIDHGIESPEIRKEQGKPEFGTISIDVIDKGNIILIHISDDGAGLDYKKIAAQAVKKNIIAQSEIDTMNEQAILELIFRPEFSTREMITDISGRGVGLDVVKSNMVDLNGDVSFSSELGKGTTFHLRIPLTLSSDIGLMIRCDEQLFVLPISAIEHVMMVDKSEIHEVGGNQVILFDAKPVPLCSLSQILNLEKTERLIKGKLALVILKKGRDKIALEVEDIEGEREIVIKPLNAPLINVPSVVGGTLLGTGEVVIVLNPSDIMNKALYGGKTNKLNLQPETLKSSRLPILLVEDSITTRTLEKNILEHNEYQVTLAVDGKEAWDLLQKQSFSLVITDVEMPNMDGFELTELIKKSEKLQKIPVIIVTSLSSEAQKKRGIEVGANAYIVKHDFESTELLDIIEQLV